MGNTHSSRASALSAVRRGGSFSNSATKVRQSRMSVKACAWNGRLTWPACFMSPTYDFGVDNSDVFCRCAVKTV